MLTVYDIQRVCPIKLQYKDNIMRIYEISKNAHSNGCNANKIYCLRGDGIFISVNYSTHLLIDTSVCLKEKYVK